MNRHTILSAGLLAFLPAMNACLCSAYAAAPSAAALQRPNILFVVADDWSWPHAGVYGDRTVKTPHFDRLAREGVLFNNAFVAAPSCTTSRGAMLTGQAIHRLREGGNQTGYWPKGIPVYPDLLEQAGYKVGCVGKGWAPGTLKGSGRTQNPAGPSFKRVPDFLAAIPKDTPFCLWLGSRFPHRPYQPGSGIRAGIDAAKVVVPGFLPDTPTVRKDLCDYCFEVQRFDRELGEALHALQAAGQLDNTLIAVTGDNGFPFPRAKTTLYDSGTHVPLAIRWPGKVPGGRVVDDLVSLTDLAPTFLEATGLKPLPEMTGRSLLGLLTSGRSGNVEPQRDMVFTERERHGICRPESQSYPVRAVRTREYLYIRNFRPELWPAGDPDHPDNPLGDSDPSPTRSELVERSQDPKLARYYGMAFAKRPAEELYDLRSDPSQLNNLAGKAEHAKTQAKLRAGLQGWMAATGDPRAKGETDFWDKCVFARDIKSSKKK